MLLHRSLALLNREVSSDLCVSRQDPGCRQWRGKKPACRFSCCYPASRTLDKGRLDWHGKVAMTLRIFEGCKSSGRVLQIGRSYSCAWPKDPTRKALGGPNLTAVSAVQSKHVVNLLPTVWSPYSQLENIRMRRHKLTAPASANALRPSATLALSLQSHDPLCSALDVCPGPDLRHHQDRVVLMCSTRVCCAPRRSMVHVRPTDRSRKLSDIGL